MYKWHERKDNEVGGNISLVYLLREDNGPIFCHIGVYHVAYPPAMVEILDAMERSATDNGLEFTSWRSQILGS